MMKNVVISIRSIHDCGLDDQDIIEFTTYGLYMLDGDTACLTYMETVVTGMDGTRTSVMVMPDKVVVDHDGSITSRMIFREGEKTSFLYDTPVGQTTLSISTRSILHSFDANGGSVELDYVLDMEHTVISRNRFELNVTLLKQMGEQINV